MSTRSFLAAAFVVFCASAAAEEFSYRCLGRDIVLRPDERYVALKLEPGCLGLPLTFLSPDLAACRRSEVPALLKRLGAHVRYELPIFLRPSHVALSDAEVIAAVRPGVGIDEARSEIIRSGGQIEREWDFSPRLLLVRVPEPAGGGAFRYARELGSRGQFLYAEPNLRLFLRPSVPKVQAMTERRISSALSAILPSSIPSIGFERHPYPWKQERITWQVLFSEDFEKPIDETWHLVSSGPLFADARWGRTDYRSKSGSRSLHCARDGVHGVTPPAPYPPDALSVALTPAFDLSSYAKESAEVYLEYWVYYKTEEPDYFGYPYDYSWCLLYDLEGLEWHSLCAMEPGFVYGDGTAEPGTAAGWQLVLVSVPRPLRKKRVAFLFAFSSDGSNGDEGVYIDDLKVWATDNIDAFPITGDPFSAGSGRSRTAASSHMAPRTRRSRRRGQRSRCRLTSPWRSSTMA